MIKIPPTHDSATSTKENMVVTTWKDVRADMRALNPTFASIIDDIQFDNSTFKIIKVRYPYGQLILDFGKLNIPDAYGRFVTSQSSTLPKSIRQLLDYCYGAPLIMQKEKQAEVFLDYGIKFSYKRTAPLKTFKPGDLYGLFELASAFSGDNVNLFWNVSSGARTTFMLPKINNKRCLQMMSKNINFNFHQSKSLYDHWTSFKEIVKRRECDWASEVIIFTRPWIEKITNDKSWQALKYYLFQQAWTQASTIRETPMINYFWDRLGERIRRRNYKPNPYIIDTMKHLIKLGNGNVPGLVPSTQACNEYIPAKTIQECYTNDYGLKDYYPTLFIPSAPSSCQRDPFIYYSINYPTLIHGTPSIREPKKIITELRELNTLFGILLDEVKNSEYSTYDYLMHVNFTFFHGSIDSNLDVDNDIDIMLQDKNLTPYQKRKSISLKSPFLIGCIRMDVLNDKYKK